MINLKGLFFSDKPEDELELEREDERERAEAAGEGVDLVPDFVDASDYFEPIKKEKAEQAYGPDPGHGREASPVSEFEPQPSRPAQPTEQSATAMQPVYARDASAASGAGAGVSDDEPEAEERVMNVSLISQEATVLGDIITEGHVDIAGKVRGNVDAVGNIAVRGLVSGDLTGEKIGLYRCRVKGNMKAGTGVVIDSDSVIVGDVDTDNIVLGGKLKGDIKAVKMAVLRSDAYFIGDVVTESLAVESGAVVNGNIKTIVQGDVGAPFED